MTEGHTKEGELLTAIEKGERLRGRKTTVFGVKKINGTRVLGKGGKD